MIKICKVSAAAILAIILGAVPLRADGSAPPRYDVPAHCTSVAATVDGSQMIYRGCMQQEQEAYNALKRDWANIPASMRRHCEGVAQAVGGSYSILNACIDQELEAARDNAETEFEY